MTCTNSGVRPIPRPSQERENYIVFSDVHLGADLVQHVRPWTTERLRRVAEIDQHLCAMLEWYMKHADPEVPWKMIIAGDLVDFIGMSIAPEDEATSDDVLFGLGSRRQYAAHKLRAVVKRHARVFEKLAEFVAAGHSLALVRGNHDVEFHWQAARDAFRHAIVERLPASADAPKAAERIEFYPWFYYVKGLLYVEHGHQFDAMCSQHFQLAPVSPRDPDVISTSFSDILLRTVVRPTRGLGSEGHESTGVFDYLRLGVSLGVRGGFRLFARFVSATVRAFRRFRAHSGALGARVREIHQRRMRKWADRFDLEETALQKLAKLAPRPVTAARLAILRSMFIDTFLLVVMVALASSLLLSFAPWTVAVPVVAALLIAGVLYSRTSLRLRKADIDCDQALEVAARRIASIMPSRYVVMGHTHRPRVAELSESSTYVNLGNWATDDIDGPVDDAPRTHFVVRWAGDEPRAGLYRWDGSGTPVLEPTEPYL